MDRPFRRPICRAYECSPPTRGWTGWCRKLRIGICVFPPTRGSGRFVINIRKGECSRLRGDGPADLFGLDIAGLCSPPTRGWTGFLEFREFRRPVFPAYAGMDRPSDYGSRLG